MRLSPTQIGLRLLLYGSAPMMQFASREEGMAYGRQMLMRICQQDFGYDLRAWHAHLMATNDGGYKWSNLHRGVPKQIKSTLADPLWQQAAARAEAEALHERLIERDKRQQSAFEAAERQWAHMPRECPHCRETFTSVRSRGQCPKCGYVFYASHPLDGRKIWWIEKYQ